MIDLVSVGKKIMFYRKKLNLTQDELASKLFVTRQNISKWENGSGIPSIDSILVLSKIFNITIENLLCLDDVLYNRGTPGRTPRRNKDSSSTIPYTADDIIPKASNILVLPAPLAPINIFSNPNSSSIFSIDLKLCIFTLSTIYP